MPSALEAKTMRRVAWRLLPFSFLLFIVNYIDRVNVGFAGLQMNEELGFSPAVFGLGSGIFFLGYVIFEIPSNLLLMRVGARLWMARIMITWGILSSALAFIHSETAFYVLRFLLGVAEAGFFPGMVIYLSIWFPKAYRAKALSYFLTATVLALVIGSPLTGWVLTAFDGAWGQSGWRWMFVLEGIPAVLLGIALPFYLTNRPADAKWLGDDERLWLAETLAREEAEQKQVGNHSLMEAFRHPKVLLLTAIYFFVCTAIYGVILWLPQIIKSIGSLTSTQTGFVAAIPFVFAAIAMTLLGRYSDRTGHRRTPVVVAVFVGGAALMASTYAPTPILSLVFLCVAAMGLWGILGVFWTLPTTFLVGTAAAGGVAFINTFAQIGGFIGPFLVGWIRGATGSFQIALAVLAGSALLAALLTTRLKRDSSEPPNTSASSVVGKNI